MSIDTAIAELERSPKLLNHVARLQAFIQNEQRRREQFYHDLNEDTKAEFINGQVIVHSPVRRRHLRASFFAANLLGNFALQRGLGEVYSEKCLIRCQRNDYEPDLCFFGAAQCAGLEENQLIFPPPDLIVEVLSPSTESNDRTLKLDDYAQHGIREYWIVDADERTVEQYVLPADAERYDLKAQLAENGHLASVVLPGFAVPVAALFDARANQLALQALAGQS